MRKVTQLPLFGVDLTNTVTFCPKQNPMEIAVPKGL